MEKKYEKYPYGTMNGKYYYSIRSLRDFGNVKKGQFGGLIENEHNLSHDGDCWIPSFSSAHGPTKISGNVILKPFVEILHNIDSFENVEPFICPGFKYVANYSGYELVDESKIHYVRVGCQDHKIEDWKNEEFRNIVIKENNFPKHLIDMYLNWLNELEYNLQKENRNEN